MAVVRRLNNLKKVPGAELQKNRNKLARASWKYHFFKLSEVDNYVNYLTDDVKPESPQTLRHTTLTKLNYFIPARVYTGKWSVGKVFMKYHTGFKLGQFTKTRKPFYFRSKKKKSVTKKNPISLIFKYVTGGRPYASCNPLSSRC